VYGVGEQAGDVGVEAPEEGVVTGAARTLAIAQAPDDGAAVELVAGHAEFGFFGDDQAVGLGRLEQRGDDVLVVLVPLMRAA
jgi:hypothetical protein